MNLSRPTFARTLGLVVGLSLFAAGLILVGTATSAERVLPAIESDAWVTNGTATKAYVLPRLPLGEITVIFAFPAASGSVRVLDCQDWDRVLDGQPPQDPLVLRENLQSGSFRYQLDPIAYPVLERRDGMVNPPPPDPPRLFGACSQVYVTFEWEVPAGASPQDTAPVADVRLHVRTMTASASVAFAGLCVVGAALVFAAVLAPARPSPTPAATLENGTAEALLEATQHSVDWMRRTQRYLAVAGILGVFIWYPVLVPLAYWWGRGLPPGSPPAAVMASVTFVFLVALSLFWWQEHRRLSEDLQRWERRLEALRRRDLDLLEPAPPIA